MSNDSDLICRLKFFSAESLPMELKMVAETQL